MKTKFVLFGAALFGASLALAADHVDISQLPEPVKSALRASADGGKVKEVTIRSVGGRTIYDVELDRENAVNARLRIAADGTIIRHSRQPASDEDLVRRTSIASSGEFGAPLYIPKANFEELPRIVQQTLTKEAGGRQISSISTDRVDGRKAYLVEFAERGRNPRLFVAEDGTVLRPEEKPRALVGTVFSDVPRAVQEAIRREIGDGQILNIDKKGLITEPRSYVVEIRNHEERFKLYIAEDGTTTRDSRQGVGPSNAK